MKRFRWLVMVGAAMALSTPPGADGAPTMQGAVRLPAAAGGSWWAQARSGIEAQEYRITRIAADAPNGAAYGAPNRRHNLRATFAQTGVTLRDRTAPGAPELVSFALAAVGRGASLSAISGAPEIFVDADRVSLRRAGITEWYRNTPAGLEQGFEILRRPPGDGELALLLETKGASLRLSSGQVLIRTRTGRELAYGKLKIVDADGADVAGRLALRGDDGLVIAMDDAGHRYPLSVDPLITGVADALLDADQASANFAYAVAAAGDVNDDGFADVVVGAPFYDGGQADEGAAFVFHGSAAGVATIAATTLEADLAGAAFGWSVAGAGDVNNDGFADVIVGAFTYNWGDGDEGAAFVYHGGAGGVATPPASTLDEGQAGAYFGYSVAGAGDVNGDGFGDVVVGAYLFDNGEPDEGAAFVYHGSAAGVAVDFSALLEPDLAGAWYGTSVAGAGDVNGDEFADVVVGAPHFANGEAGEGAAFVHHGSAAGVAQAAASQLESDQAGASSGISVAGAGDVNGDGFADVIVGAYLFDNGEADEGAAFVYHGSAAGVAQAAAAQLESDQVEASSGISVAGAGDVDGDGFADVVVGAYLFDNGEADEGAAFVYHGSAAGVAPPVAAQLEGGQAGAYFGFAVSGAGDVNGDGFADVVVGAPFFANGEVDEGAAFVYHGSAAPPVFPTSRIGVFRSGAWYLDKGAAGWQGAGVDGIVPAFGIATDTPVAADVNGDGFAEIGVFRSGKWFFDLDGSGTWGGCTSSGGTDLCVAQFGMAGDVPVTGDWNGDGSAEIGVFRRGQWYLDADGSGTWSAGSDRVVPGFGLSTDTPVAGDWNGDGTTDIGVFRGGSWYLDANGSWGWDGVAGGDRVNAFGTAGDLPAPGDWNADGVTEIAVFRPSTGRWYLDDGSGQWESGADQAIAGFGISVDRPVTGAWR